MRTLVWIRNAVLNITAVLGVLTILVLVAGWVFGIRPLVVVSGSMEPTISTGALIFSQNVDATSLEAGDIVTVPKRTGSELVTHRIVGIEDVSGGGASRELTLRGDANDTDDPYTYTVESAGLHRFTIPGGGYVVSFFQSKQGLIMVAGVVAMVVILLVATAGETGGRKPGDEDAQPEAESAAGAPPGPTDPVVAPPAHQRSRLLGRLRRDPDRGGASASGPVGGAADPLAFVAQSTPVQLAAPTPVAPVDQPVLGSTAGTPAAGPVEQTVITPVRPWQDPFGERVAARPPRTVTVDEPATGQPAAAVPVAAPAVPTPAVASAVAEMPVPDGALTLIQQVLGQGMSVATTAQGQPVAWMLVPLVLGQGPSGLAVPFGAGAAPVGAPDVGMSGLTGPAGRPGTTDGASMAPAPAASEPVRAASAVPAPSGTAPAAEGGTSTVVCDQATRRDRAVRTRDRADLHLVSSTPALAVVRDLPVPRAPGAVPSHTSPLYLASVERASGAGGPDLGEVLLGVPPTPDLLALPTVPALPDTARVEGAEPGAPAAAVTPPSRRRRRRGGRHAAPEDEPAAGA